MTRAVLPRYTASIAVKCVGFADQPTDEQVELASHVPITRDVTDSHLVGLMAEACRKRFGAGVLRREGDGWVYGRHIPGSIGGNLIT